MPAAHKLRIRSRSWFNAQVGSDPAAAKWFDRASAAALLAVLAVVLFTFDDYGMSWDEPHSIAYGRRVLAFLLTFGKERSSLEGEIALRGGHFHAFVEALAAPWPEHALLIRRLVTPLVGSVGLVGSWRLGRLLGGPRAGFFSLVLLALTPLYFGHMFINPADIPFAAAYVWAVQLALTFSLELPRPRWTTIVLCGLAGGIAIGARIVGLLVVAMLAMLVAWHVVEDFRSLPASEARARGLRSIAGLLALLIVTYLVMLSLWPGALVHPLTQPIDAAFLAAKFPKHEEVLFGGRVFFSDALPRSYELGYFAVQLPELLLALFAVGLLASTQALVRAARERERARLGLEAGCLFATLAPLALAFALRPVDFDGVRHWLFVVPMVACIAGRGLDWALERARAFRVARGLLVALVVVGLARNLTALHALHPYEYTFYNAFVGGTRGATGRYELDYWVTSFREAVEALSAALVREDPALARAQTPQKKLTVCGHAVIAAVYAPRFLAITDDVRDADYVLATTKWACHMRYPGTLVAVIGREGAPFAVVKRLR